MSAVTRAPSAHTIPVPRVRNTRRIRRHLTAALLIALLTLVSVEAALALFDPLGVVYFRDMRAHYAVMTDASSGYSYAPGGYTASHWAYTIADDETRYTPSAVPGGSRVAFYGDSVTFGWGVDDDETWVNLVTGELSLNAVNLGRVGYSLANVEALLDERADSCAVFLTVYNDTEHFRTRAEYSSRGQSVTMDYARFFSVRSGYRVPQPDIAYTARLEALIDRGVLVLALDDEYGRRLAERIPALVLLSEPDSRISAADPHYDARGNRQIAAAVTPVIPAWLSNRSCS